MIAPVIGSLPSVNNGSCALPPVSEVAVEVADSELTTLPLPLALRTCNTVPDGLENCRFDAERGVELRHHRAHAAGKIDADHLIVRIRRRRLQRQRTAGAERHDRHRVLDVAGIGIGELDRVARRQRTDVDAVARTGSRTSPRSRSSSGSTAPATSGWRIRRAGSAPAAESCRASADRRRSGRTGWHCRRSDRWWCRPARRA